jgi:hypothetical protein
MIFVEYYNEFKNESNTNKEVVEKLPQKYTLKSRRSRTSHARWIFQNGLHIEALRIITSSDKVANEVQEEARRLLGIEVMP